MGRRREDVAGTAETEAGAEEAVTRTRTVQLVAAFVVALAAGFLFGLAAGSFAQAQPIERARTAEPWRAAVLPQDGRFTITRVDVVETPGACIYVTRTEARDQRPVASMVVVPRTQLPIGKGC
jgi:hypothetical protein